MTRSCFLACNRPFPFPRHSVTSKQGGDRRHRSDQSRISQDQSIGSILGSSSVFVGSDFVDRDLNWGQDYQASCEDFPRRGRPRPDVRHARRDCWQDGLEWGLSEQHEGVNSPGPTGPAGRARLTSTDRGRDPGPGLQGTRGLRRRPQWRRHDRFVAIAQTIRVGTCATSGPEAAAKALRGD